jgi:hypothetical protein
MPFFSHKSYGKYVTCLTVIPGWKFMATLLALHPPLSPLTHHWDNVTAPHGRPNLRSWLHICRAQDGGPRSPQKDMWWHWGGEVHGKDLLLGIFAVCIFLCRLMVFSYGRTGSRIIVWLIKMASFNFYIIYFKAVMKYYRCLKFW